MATVTTPFTSNFFVQKTFNGGMDTISPDTQVGETAYVGLVNARVRFGTIEPIKKHVLIDDPLALNKQAIVGIGDVIIVFVHGLAYWRKEGTTKWTQVPNFLMSTVAEKLWTCIVPDSYQNFGRKSIKEQHSDINLQLDFKISGTYAGVVVQDGYNQPMIITYNASLTLLEARKLGTFNSWQNVASVGTTVNREYVPIGRQMLYLSGVLYIVSKDKKAIMRSITGRPLDFMINVDSNGYKRAHESLGGAMSMSFAFDFDEITCIAAADVPLSFMVATRHNLRIITADTTNTIYGEPTFYVSSLIESGIVNQDSILELTGLGDFAFIDFESVISYNAVQQLKFNGRNSIFSLNLAKALKDIKQRDPCCIVFDNYALFNLKTLYGYLVAVYDLMLQKWVSWDITEITRIKQFAIVETTDSSYLYCITYDDKIWKMYADPTETYAAQMRTRSFVNDETIIEHKSQNIRLMFNGGTTEGTVALMEYVDELESELGSGKRITKLLPASIAGVRYPVMPPVIPNTISRVDNPTFITKEGLRGKKLAYIIQWDNDAKLIEFELTTTLQKSTISAKETNQTLTNSYGS